MKVSTVSIVCVITLATIIASILGAPIGDRVITNFLSRNRLPLYEKEAVQNGWESINGGMCIKGLGKGYTNKREVVWYTSAGQFSGFGARLYADMPQFDNSTFWKKVEKEVYEIDIATRDPKVICSGEVDKQGGETGDRLILAPTKAALAIPLNTTAATVQKWTKGGCIGGMGTHWGLDLKTGPLLSGYSANLVPAVPMYVNGTVSAVLFYAPKSQMPGQWEGPFPRSIFCMNFCSSNCMEHEGTFSFYATMHFLFHDPALNSCETRCEQSRKGFLN